MNFEPQRFFVGLIDFFAVILPGALLTYVFMQPVGPGVLGDRFEKLGGAAAIAAFVVASYLVGHFVFLIGSSLDGFYGWARGYTLGGQIEKLAKGGRLDPWPGRALARIVFKGEQNIAYRQAAQLHKEALDPLHASAALSVFQWSKALLSDRSPSNLAVVQRFEADSKFFRSFVVVLVIILIGWPLHNLWPPVIGIPVVLFLTLVALGRYMEQRLKSTNQAYYAVITLVAQDRVAQDRKVPFQPINREVGHAGGVVFREHNDEREYVVCQDGDNREAWVLPAGKVRDDEQLCNAAVRIVREQTGVWARISNQPQDCAYSVDGKSHTVEFYPMERLGNSRKKNTRVRWLPVCKLAYEARQVVDALIPK
jgi:ADP-ribose pyrophosphatase YjhB (NUDIX family)